MTRSTVAALVGFAFIFVCFDQTFWIALLCLLGAAVGYAIERLIRGGVSIAELQERMEGARDGFRSGGAPRVR